MFQKRKKQYRVVFVFLVTVMILFSCGNKKNSKGVIAPAFEIADLNIDFTADSSALNNYKPVKADSRLKNLELRYFEAKPISDIMPPAINDGKPLSILDCNPKDKIPDELTRNLSLTLLFSKPMVPLAKLGEVISSIKNVTISPPLEGIFRWYGSSILAFEPKGALEPLCKYTITVKAGMEGLFGAKLDKDYSYTFYAKELRIVSCDVDAPTGIFINKEDVPPAYMKNLVLSFNYGVDPKHIAQFISIVQNSKTGATSTSLSFTCAQNQSLKYDPNKFQRTVLVTITDDISADSDIIVTLKEGASPKVGMIGSEKSYETKFHTIKPFIYQSTNAHGSYYDYNKSHTNPVYFIFSHPLNMDTVASNLEVSALSKDKNVADHISVYQNQIKLFGLEVDYQSSYQVLLKSGIKDIYGRELSKDYPVTVKVGDAASFFNFDHSPLSTIEAGYPAKWEYSYQNTNRAWSSLSAVKDLFSFKVPSMKEVVNNIEKNVFYVEHEDFSNLLNASKKCVIYTGKGFEVEDYRSPNSTNPVTYSPVYSNALFQVSDMGITGRYDYQKALIVVRALSSGAAVSNALVELFDCDPKNSNKLIASGKTDKNGFVTISYKDYPFYAYNNLYFQRNKDNFSLSLSGMVVKVSKGDDVLYHSFSHEHNRWSANIYNYSDPKSVLEERVENFCFTDRGLYKPGETVSFRGIMQKHSVGDYSPCEGTIDVRVNQIYGNSGKPLFSQKIKLTKSGGYFGSFQIPKNSTLGYYTIDVEYGDSHHYTNFSVQEFKRAEFALELMGKKDELIAGEKISVTANGSYLSGGKMADAKCNWYWVVHSHEFVPKDNKYEHWCFGPQSFLSSHVINGEDGKLDTKGDKSVSLTSSTSIVDGKAQVYELHFSATDPSHQQLSASYQAIVHPAQFYIGAKLGNANSSGWWSHYVEAKKSINLSLVAITPDGKSYTDPVKASVVLNKKEWKQNQQQGVGGYLDYRYEWITSEVFRQQVSFNSKGEATLSFTPDEGGEYIVSVSTYDKNDNPVVTDLSFYATGANWSSWASSEPQKIELTPEKKLYKQGEVARVFMKSPLPKGDYLLTLEREKIIDSKIVTISQPTTMLEVPIASSYSPVIYLSLASSSPRTAPPPTEYGATDLGKPKLFFGMATIEVEPTASKLSVEIIPSHSLYKPGGKAAARIVVLENGKPVPEAEVSFLAVDRGVLDLIKYEISSPLEFFYNKDKFPHSVLGGDSRSVIQSPIMYSTMARKGGDMGKDGMLESAAFSDMMRNDFNPLAVFEPMLFTNKDGYVDVVFDLPDTLTTYRATAIAINGNKFGIDNQSFRAQNPITVRTAKPQALRLRDKATIEVLLTNLSSKEVSVKVSAHSDILKLSDQQASRQIKVDANKTVSVPFSYVALLVGEARLEFKIESQMLNEVLVEKIPVLDVPIKEACTISSFINRGDKVANEGIVIPSAQDENSGSLKILLSTTPFTNISLAMDILGDISLRPLHSDFDYYYHTFPMILFGKDCEIYSSKIKYSKSDIETFVQKFSENLVKVEDGYGYKGYGDSFNIYWSAKIAEYLYFAKKAGLNLVDKNIEQGLVRFLISRTKPNSFEAPYIYYVRALYGENVSHLIPKNFKDKEGDTTQTQLYYGLALSQSGAAQRASECYQEIKNMVSFSTQSVDLKPSFQSLYKDSLMPAINLALLSRLGYRVEGLNDYTQRYVQTINNRLTNSRWGWFEDPINYLIAAREIGLNPLSKDGGKKEKSHVKVVIGGKTIIEKDLNAITSPYFTKEFLLVENPLNSLAKDKQLPFVFETSDEKGALFYTAILEYALPAEVTNARDEGIALIRKIYTLDGKEVKDALTLGESYRMVLSLSTTKLRYGVQIVAPIPSGCDFINGSFATSDPHFDRGGLLNTTYELAGAYGDVVKSEQLPWWISFYNPSVLFYKNFASYQMATLLRGVVTLDFVFRATTAGVYPTPPATVSVAQEPEVFGRSQGVIYTVK